MEEQAVEKLLLRLKKYIEDETKTENDEVEDEFKPVREKVRERLLKMKKGEDSIDFNVNTEKGKVISTIKTTIEILEKKLQKMELQCKVKNDKIKMLEKMLNEDNSVL